jgi:hypothetical protein
MCLNSGVGHAATFRGDAEPWRLVDAPYYQSFISFKYTGFMAHLNQKYCFIH